MDAAAYQRSPANGGTIGTSRRPPRVTSRNVVAQAARKNPKPAYEVIAGVPLVELASIDGAETGPRSKRRAIIEQAVARFGEIGFEATKWSSVSDQVGIGQAALYYYFESKAHCLLTIIRLELARAHKAFLEATDEAPSASAAIEAALRQAFRLSAAEMRQVRIVMANGDVLANPRSSDREEQERRLSLALTHIIEDAWTELLARNAAEGGDDRDPRMLARAVLGLLNSVWRWYRPKGKLSIVELSDFYVSSATQIIGRQGPPRSVADSVQHLA